MTTTTNTAVKFNMTLEDGTSITISKNGDWFVIDWNDGFVNEWVESYSSLSAAMARAALIVACYESDWNRCFTMANEDGHATSWVQYLKQVLN